MSAQYLGAMQTYQEAYAVDLQVIDDVLAKIHEFMLSGLQGDKAYTYQSPLRIQARFSHVKREAESMDPADLPGVELPLD